MAFDSNVFARSADANIPVTLEVTDPDLVANAPAFVEAVLRNASGDSEMFRLFPTGAGRYSLPTIPTRSGSPFVGNGVLEFSNSGPITAEYRDTTTPSGVAQTLTQSCGSYIQIARLATISISPSGIAPGSPSQIAFAGPITAPCNITVRDPDLINASGVLVRVVATQVSSAKVDNETFTLPAVSPGVFQKSTCQYQGYPIGTAIAAGSPISGNGIIELGGGATTITVSYIDTTIPGGGSQVLTATVTVNN